jgi:epoxide hydrolase 4
VLEYYRQAAGGLDILTRRREALAGPDTIVPVTVLWGDADLALAPTHPDAVRQHARRLEIRRLPGVSHWVAEERPLEVVRALIEGDTGSAAPLA